MIELSGGYTRGLLNLISSGKALSSEGVAPKQTPPPLLQVEPAGSSRNEDVMEARMLDQPSAGLGTVVTGEVVGDEEDVARRIVGFDSSQQANVVRRVARGGASRQFLAIAHTQCPRDPGFLRTATVIQWRFDAVPVSRPAWGWSKTPWDHRPEFIGADGRRALGWLGVVADDRRPDCGQSLDHCWFPSCASDANALPPAGRCAGSGSV